MQDRIVIEGVGKRFTRYHADRPQRFKEILLRGFKHLQPVEKFWALRHVDLQVAAGEMIGIIGHNGSGKSTLLRLIGGLMAPDEGRIKVHGHIGGLLELGSGFHEDLTGRENIFINGVVGGLLRREVEERFDQIVEFAELSEFIDNPLRTYSTGMRMRLGFAITIHNEPDVLLVDEVLAVGDIAFQNKCLQRIEQLKARGCAILLVSHDSGQIRRLCDKVLWMRRGAVVAWGDPEVVVGQYETEMASETRRRTPQHHPDETTSSGRLLRINQNRFGDLQMQITDVRLLDRKGVPVTHLQSGEALNIEISYHAPQPLPQPVFSVTISSDQTQHCFDCNTSELQLLESTADGTAKLEGKGQLLLRLERLDLSANQYYVDVGVYETNWSHAYDYHWHAHPLVVEGKSGKGILDPPYHWKLLPHNADS
jgi:lipopolysaccharide transport system ATP-binding protein